MRKPPTLKPKIWGSSATLHFWERAPAGRTPNVGQLGTGDGEPGNCDLEQITHGRWHSPSDNFGWFNPTILGASPFERRAIAIKKR